MTTVEEAQQIISNHLIPTTTESVPLGESYNRVLAEPLLADRPFPPFNRVTMDGIAIKWKSFDDGQRNFPIAALAPAGAPQVTLTDANACVEVMTGAVLPEGTDTVIRYEDLEVSDKSATIQVPTVKFQQNVHTTGSDRKKEDLLTSPGRVIGPPEIGIAATIGKSTLLVNRRPSIVVISTGDELVPVDQTPEAHQIRRSNVHTIVTTLLSRGIKTVEKHLIDDQQAITKQLKELLEQHDVLILSGGVSKGKFDYVPAVLEELDFQKLFHGVRQRPGKPFWFGTNGKNVVFALPGNPVSSYMCTIRYIHPWLDQVIGLPKQAIPTAILADDFTFKPDLTYMLQVKIRYNEKGQILALPIAGGGSGDLANLGDVDAFLELPRGRELFRAGEVFALWRFR